MTKTAFVLLLLAAGATARLAQGQAAPPERAEWSESPEVVTQTAAVAIDGEVLFRVRGFSSLPADQRAAAIADRIEGIARDRAISPGAVGVVEVEGELQIKAGDRFVMSVRSSDGRREGVGAPVLAQGHLQRVREAIARYREARSRPVLVRGALLGAGALAAWLSSCFLVVWLVRKLSAFLESRYRERLRSVGVQSLEILRADQLWTALRRSLKVVRTAALVLLSLLALHFVLGLFPWTRPFSRSLSAYLAHPVRVLFDGLVAALPDLVFLAVLVLVFRYLLRLVRVFFHALERGAVSYPGFEPEWASPTYRIVRLAVIAFAIVVSYPYIPGSGSAAFKGVSLFLGILFSIGSSSFMANIVAGYAVTYRRAFRVGDRVRIGDVVGDVTELRLQGTQVRTPKNEEVTVPNSQILGTSVVNYSRMARREGLVLHTTVGIGYDTPWRQVEAMLLLAAGRAPGLLKEPPPFVHLTTLGDFCVNFELNVYCDAPKRMASHYTELHRQILDVFNEYGVQIMSPAYEGDPAEPKVVPKEQWFAAPAAGPRRVDPGESTPTALGGT